MTDDFKIEFIQFAIENEALKFGSFKLKSGRISPYFFDAGRLVNTGAKLSKMGEFYAKAMTDLDFDMLYGPAYKGIPLVAAASIFMSKMYNKDVPIVFNRKEVKDHGEGGVMIGTAPFGKVVIIDDVITAGTAIRESMNLINNAQITGVVVCLDRQERGNGVKSSIKELQEEFGIQVTSIVCLDDILAFVHSSPEFSKFSDAIASYKLQYGA